MDSTFDENDAVGAMDDDSFQTGSLRTAGFQMRNRNSALRGSTFSSSTHSTLRGSTFSSSTHASRKSHQFTSRQRSSFLGTMQDSTLLGRFDESTPDMMRTGASRRMSSHNMFTSMHEMDISLVEDSSPHRRRESHSLGSFEEGDELQGEDQSQGVVAYVGDTVASAWNKVDAAFWDGMDAVGATFGGESTTTDDDSRSARRRSTYDSFGLAQIGEEDVLLANPQDNSFHDNNQDGPFDTLNRNMSFISKRLSSVSLASFEDDSSDYYENYHHNSSTENNGGGGVWEALPDLGVSEWMEERGHILSHNVSVIQEEMQDQAEYVAGALGQTIHGGLDTLGMTIHGPSHSSPYEQEEEAEKSILAKNVEYIADSLGKTIHGSAPAQAPNEEEEEDQQEPAEWDDDAPEEEEEEKSILEKNVEFLQRQGASIAHDLGNAFSSAREDAKWHQSNSDIHLSL